MSRTKRRSENRNQPPEALLRKVAVRSIRLAKLVVQTSEAEFTEGTRLVRENSLSPKKVADDELILKLVDTIKFEPSGPFTVELELIGRYSILRQETIDENALKDQIEVLGVPLLETASILIGLLVEKVSGTPLLLPPRLTSSSRRAKKRERPEE